jgi:putative heme iron utilization protein
MEHRENVLSEEDATRIINHMNAEHEDDLLLFAQVYAGEPGATAARMTGIDAEGITLDVATADGQKELRIDFDEPLHTPEDAHRALVDMALNARG